MNPVHPTITNRNSTSSSSGNIVLNNDYAYVFFVPGGDAVVYFMGAVFVAIILDKIIMG